MQLVRVALLFAASTSTALAIACSSSAPSSTPVDAGADATSDVDAAHDGDAGNDATSNADAGDSATGAIDGGDAGDASSIDTDADPGSTCDAAPPPLGTDVCDHDAEVARWQTMVSAPIALNPIRAAGLNLGVPDAGITIDDAMTTDCQAFPAYGDCTTYTVGWGQNGQVLGSFLLSTRELYYLGLQLGYVGQLQFQTASPAHAYVIEVGSRVTRDGQPISLDWSNAAALDAIADELYRALIETFAPGTKLSPTSCVATGDCVVSTFSDQSGYMFFKPLGFAFRVQSTVDPQPTPSLVYYVDLYAEPLLP